VVERENEHPHNTLYIDKHSLKQPEIRNCKWTDSRMQNPIDELKLFIDIETSRLRLKSL